MSFFQAAFAAANISVEAFRAECAKTGANVNAREYYSYGDHLIFKLIQRLDDDKLLACLQIMHEYGLDISVTDELDHTPLHKATLWGMPKSVNFLISIGSSIHDVGVLIAASDTLISKADIQLIITKNLIETHNAKIDQQDRYGYTALIKAAENKDFNIIKYLLSKNANLLPRVSRNPGAQSLTALSFSFKEYVSVTKIFGQTHEYAKNAKACFALLINAAYPLFYSRCLISQAQELELLEALTGSFEPTFCKEQNSESLNAIIREQALKPAKERLIQEKSQRVAFFMASKAKNDVPLKKDFLHADTFDNNIAKMIFSYFHESIRFHEQLKHVDMETEIPSLKH